MKKTFTGAGAVCEGCCSIERRVVFEVGLSSKNVYFQTGVPIKVKRITKSEIENQNKPEFVHVVWQASNWVIGRIEKEIKIYIAVEPLPGIQ